MERSNGSDIDDRRSAFFFYGTLMAPAILQRVIWGASGRGGSARVTARPAMLDGFCRRKVRGRDYPGVVRQAGWRVRGTLVVGLTAREVARLDVFEGDEYARETVRVRLLPVREGGGPAEQVIVETYVYRDAAGLEEAEWDFDEFVRVKMWRWVDSSGEYDGLDDNDVPAPASNGDADNGRDPTSGRGF